MNSQPQVTWRSAAANLSGLALLAAASTAAIIAVEPVTAVSFREPERESPKTEGGGVRSGSAIAALVPPSSGSGLTNQARPIFLVYLAPEASQGKEAVFFLQDAKRDVLFEATIPLEGQSGVVAFQLPEAFQDLEVERPYDWFLALTKTEDDSKLGVGTPFVRGKIERLPAAPAEAGELTLSLEAAIAASQGGRWYDAAAILAALRQAQPEDPEIEGHWQEFLQSVELGHVAGAPSVRLSAQPE